MNIKKIILVLFLFSLSGCYGSPNITVIQMEFLHKYAIRDDIEGAKTSISEGALLNSRNSYGWAALHYAAVKNSAEMIQLFIDAGCNINIREKRRGQTPLHFAALTSKNKAVEKLLLNSANPYIKDIDGRTPKRLATKKEIIDLFEKYGY